MTSSLVFWTAHFCVHTCLWNKKKSWEQICLWTSLHNFPIHVIRTWYWRVLIPNVNNSSVIEFIFNVPLTTYGTTATSVERNLMNDPHSECFGVNFVKNLSRNYFTIFFEKNMVLVDDIFFFFYISQYFWQMTIYIFFKYLFYTFLFIFYWILFSCLEKITRVLFMIRQKDIEMFFVESLEGLWK